MQAGPGEQGFHVSGAGRFLERRSGNFRDANLFLGDGLYVCTENFENADDARIVLRLRRRGLSCEILEERSQCDTNREK